jgi:succinate-acetate transporter protein
MKVTFDLSTLALTRWHEYGVRFFLGGAITVIAGLLAKRFGPIFGGLFLAFPAIFPASATLVEKHEQEKKRKAGIVNTARGRQAAALDARGATIGSFGLACFALLVWKLLPAWNPGVVLVAAVSLWLGVSVLIWRASKRHRGR